MSEEKDIGKIMEEMLNRPLELIEENKKLKKKIDKLQKDNYKLDRENIFLNSHIKYIKSYLTRFIPKSTRECEIKTKILNKIRGDNND